MSLKNTLAVGAAVVAAVLLGTFLQARPSASAQQDVAAAKAAAPATPLFSGKLINVTVWQYPVESARSTNTGESYQGGRVDFYDRFLILTRPSGDRTVVWHGYYTGLWFKD